MKLLRIFFIMSFATATHPVYKSSGKAVCIVPVADLLGESLQEVTTHGKYSYHSLPIAYKNFEGPARVHQLLFNEVVDIKDVRGKEMLVELPQLFYETTTLKRPQTLYWTATKNLRPLQLLADQGISLSTFPQPLTRTKVTFEKALHNTVSLTQPFFDGATGLTYSAGTRFVVAEQQNSPDHIVAHLFDIKKNSSSTITLPKHVCLVHEEKSNEQRVADFVNIVVSWAHQSSGFIPYVWGGCSVSGLCKQDQFTEHNDTFSRPELSTSFPIAGLDCTGLVARAAHLAGIPYFYKNSFTIAKYVAPLGKDEKISEGDLLWIPGHVMVVSSVKNALLVEARHYSHGYGKVHEIKLEQQFKGMHSYQDLITAFFSKKSLKRLDRSGKIVQVVPGFKILKLSSIWNA